MNAWIRLPLSMLQSKELSLTACVVYAIIADRTDNNEIIQMSAKEIADTAGISRHTAMRALSELEQKNYIITEKRAGEKQHIRLRAIILQQKKRSRSATSDTKEQEHSYDLQEYKTLVNKF